MTIMLTTKKMKKIITAIIIMTITNIMAMIITITMNTMTMTITAATGVTPGMVTTDMAIMEI